MIAYQKAATGFTLIELMVVVTVLGIIAAIGVPKLVSFVENAKTVAPAEYMARFADELQALASKSGTTEFNGSSTYYLTPYDSSAENTLAPYIETSPPTDHLWRYAVNLDGKADHICIKAAQKDDNVNNFVLYSRTAVYGDPIWDEHFYRVPFKTKGHGTEAVNIEKGDCAIVGVPESPDHANRK